MVAADGSNSKTTSSSTGEDRYVRREDRPLDCCLHADHYAQVVGRATSQPWSGGASALPVDVGTMLDAHHRDHPGPVVDLIEHPVSAAPRRPETG